MCSEELMGFDNFVLYVGGHGGGVGVIAMEVCCGERVGEIDTYACWAYCIVF